MELKLVNPYFIKQLPSRMSDVKDAQWIAECLLKNLIRHNVINFVVHRSPVLHIYQRVGRNWTPA